MRKYFNNEDGYALYIVLCLVVLLTVLGMSLLTITTSGNSKNKMREDITLAQDLSYKGIDYIQTDINTYFKNKMGTGLTILEFESLLKDTLEDKNKSNYLCPKTIDIQGELGKSKVCIEKTEPFSSKEEDKLRRIITVKSEGITKDSNTTKVAYSKIVVGANSIPEQLNYAISTNAGSDGKGGDLFIFGGVDVTGDIKADGNIFINPYPFTSSGGFTSPSWNTKGMTKSKLTAAAGNSYPKIIVNSNKSFFYFTTRFSSTTLDKFINKHTDYISYLTEYKVNEITADKQTEIQNLFKVTDEKNKPNEKNKPRVIVQKVEKDTINIDDLVNSDGKITLQGEPIYDKKNKIIGYKNDYSIKTKTTFGDSKKKYYIKGDLLIGKDAGTNVTDETSSDYTDINLQGEYYVDGNIKIRGAYLKGDAVFYSKNEIEVKYSVVEGYNGGTNFFFANEDINVSNLSTNTPINIPSIIDGFFYTKKQFFMFGYVANTKINGGVSANRIVFTALRGQLGKEDDDAESRLRVNYDLDIIKKFLNNRDQDTVKITTTSEPKVLEISVTPFD